MAKTITSYDEFWPFYLAEHSKPATRAFHYLGILGLIAVAIYALLSGNWWALILSPPALYACAWFSHFFIEHNKPATFTYPSWSLMADFKMFSLGMTGRLGAELEKYQIIPRP